MDPKVGNDISHFASLFAKAAHGATGQVRRYTGEPYFVHVDNVAKMVASVMITRDFLAPAGEAIAIAYLHDVVEDTDITIDMIHDIFGPVVAEGVRFLTDTGKDEHPNTNRAHRKEMDRERIAKAPDYVKTVKLADLIDNSDTIVKYDPNFAVVYMKEKRLLLPMLIGGDSELFKRASDIVLNYYKLE